MDTLWALVGLLTQLHGLLVQSQALAMTVTPPRPRCRGERSQDHDKEDQRKWQGSALKCLEKAFCLEILAVGANEKAPDREVRGFV